MHETEFGGYEYPSRRFLDIHLAPGDLFIDVGAHWGIYTLTAATRWPGQVAGLAIEPVPENAAILRRNIEQNGLGSVVEVVEAAAGAAAGQARLFRDSSMGHSLYPTGDGAASPHPDLTTSLVTLDDLLAARPHLAERRTFLKIDAEGHEPEVLQGGRGLVSSGRVAAIIWEKGALYDAGPHKERMLGMIEYLHQHGFRQFRFPHENLGGSLTPFVVSHERCNVFALAPGFSIAPVYDKPSGPAAPAVPAAPIPMTSAERVALTNALASVGGSDGGRWADPASLLGAWDGRAARVADHIPRGAHVLDVGAGAMALRRFLDASVRYTPADLVAREPGCLVADLNQGQFPEGRYDYVTMLGVLEYLHDVPAVLRRARAAAPRAILTYSLFAGENRDNRRSLGWFNDYTAEELTHLLAESDWYVSSVEAIENNQVILICRDGTTSGLRGFPIVPARKRVLVVGYHNATNFGDRLGYHLIPSILPPHCDVVFGTFHPWQIPEGTYDLVIVGIGNSLFAPLLTDDLQRLVDAAPHSIGIFGTQYRDRLPADRLHRFIASLTAWYARYEEDLYLYGRGHQNVHHLGDWLALLCPLGTPSLQQELVVRPDFIQSEAPLDRVIQDIQRYQQVHSARIHPLLVALHSAATVSYEEQREMGDGQVSGKFRSLLVDVFEKSYPERERFSVNRHLVSTYQARVRANSAHLTAAIQAMLGDGKWTARGITP
jgi:FkbM family methyltransferase